MTTWLVTRGTDDLDAGRADVLNDDEIQDLMAEFFATADAVPNGDGILIRKADYLGLAAFDREAAIAYIDGTTTLEDRRACKAQVSHVIYGNSPSN